MRIHYVIHAPFENLGSIESWALSHGHELTCTNTYLGEVLPNVSAFDLIIIMGGPQSSLEIDKYPYLKDEIQFAKSAINENKKIFGICLGAQIIGEALGAKPHKSPNKEIGHYPIELLDAGVNDQIFGKMPKYFDVMHWHNDMPGIIAGMEILAKSVGCPNQAFRFGDRVYGMQFHMELTKESVESLILHCPEDLLPGKFIRSERELLDFDFKTMNERMTMFLDGLSKL